MTSPALGDTLIARFSVALSSDDGSARTCASSALIMPGEKYVAV